MNITLQICGLVIVVYLLVLHRTHRTLGLQGEQVFLMMLAATIICLSLDALSVVAINFRSRMPLILTQVVCKAYLVSMIWVGWVNFCYVTLELNSDTRSHNRLMRIMCLVTVAESLCTALLPIGIFQEGAQVYTYGPAVVSTYVFVLFYIISTMTVAVYIRRKKNSRRGLAVILTTSLWIFAAGLQMLNNAFLVVGFSMAVGTMILYVVMENPDSNLDRQIGCFNSYAMSNYLAMRMEAGTPFGVLDFSVTDVKALEDKGMNVTDVARSIVSRMEAVPGVMVFKNQTTGLVAISDDAAQLDQVSDLLMKAAAEYRDAANSVLLFTVSNAERFGTAAELQKFLTYVRSRSSGRLSVMVHVSEAMIQQYSQAQEIEKEIDAALEEDRVEVFYQPIFNSAAQRVTAAEALVRIRGRDGKLLSPGLFIPVAETTGQVKALGERVLEKVCGFLRDSAVRELGIRMIDVNLSAVQCDDSAMSGRLSQIVESYGIEPGLINFEITETAVSEVKDVLIENMNALVSKGFSFALDDFGKGESNLMYIVELPCQILKLDMDMSKAYFSNPKARPVVEAIVELAHKLNLSSIAEGIETREEAAGIIAAGIDSIQGFYYSRPLPADEFLAYLETSAAPAGEAPAAQPAQTVPAPAETTQRVLEVRSILLVEDNEMNREIATDILEDCGYLVETAEDGSLAVEMVAKAAPGRYDLVLMDIRMPIMDGYEATRRIRQLEESRLAGVPIVALTAQDGEEDRLLAFEAGMDGHIVKPLDAKKLELMLAELAGKTAVC